MTRLARFRSANAVALAAVVVSAPAHAAPAPGPAAVRHTLLPGGARAARALEAPAAPVDGPAGTGARSPSPFGGPSLRSLHDALASGRGTAPRIRELIAGPAAGDGAVIDDTGATLPGTNGLGLPYDPINLAAAGDTDNNGSTDWIRGEPFFSPPVGVGAGHVTLYQRSPTGTTFTVEINGPEAFAGFGAAVASAGDVNGDGYDEVIVGAPGFDSQRGRAFVYRGSPGGPTVAMPWTVTGTQPLGYLGYSVAGAGDVNGDGYDDVLVGEPGLDSPSFAGGRVYCFHGGPTGLDALPAWSISGVQGNEFVGWAVAGNGDVNADGYADVLVGGPGWDNGQNEEGRIRLFLGGPGGLSTTAAWNFEPNQASWSAGKAVALPGDLDGDGFGDVAMGIAEADFLGTDDGVIRVYGGSPFTFALPMRFEFGGGESFAHLGSAVAAAGDLNGDGFADAAFSAPGFGANDGGAWITLYGAPDYGTFGSYLYYYGPDFSGAGTDIAGGGDSGNGAVDLLLGLANYVEPPLKTGTGAREATAGVLAPYLLVTPGITFDEIGYAPSRPFAQGSFYETRVGQSIGIGDVNGDGFADALVGGPEFGNGLYAAGHVLVYHGSPSGFGGSPPPVVVGSGGGGEPAGVLPAFVPADWFYEGQVDSARFGQSVAGAGDVNGDGYDDLIVGAPLATYGQPEEGAAYVFHGGPDGLETQPSWRVEGNAAVNYFGYSVAAAGDVNQDGYGDVLVGAPLADPGGIEDAGTVSLFYGSPTGLAHAPARVFSGSMPNGIMGTSGVGVGDVDGDGYPDIAVHEPYFDAGFDYPGRLDLYRGGAAGPSAVPLYTFGPTAEFGVLGFHLAPAGDVNGDGYADFMASGAQVVTKGSAMAVLLFTGSPTGPGPLPTSVLRPDQATAFEGYRIAPGGDMNKDGFGEIIIGSPYYAGVLAPTPDPQLGGVAADGRVTVHFGSPTGAEPGERLDFVDPGALGEVGWAVAGGGDLNGDGWPDLLFSAPAANSGKLLDNGLLHVGFANIVSGGLARPMRMLRSDNFTPIAHGLRSDLPGGFRLASLARTPVGRGRVRMQWQVKPPAAPFDGSGIQSSAALRTLAPDEEDGSAIPLNGVATGLASGQRYRWRLRHATRHPNFPRSRWTTPHSDGLLLTDLRTAGPTGAVDVGEPVAGGGRALALAGAWPNPLAAEEGGAVHFALPAAGRLTIDAHDARGRRVARVHDGEAAAGPGIARWDARDDAGHALPRGLYFLRLVFAGEERTAKVVIAP